MSKLRAFVHLDFVTVKPYFTGKNLLVYMGISAFLTIMSANLASGVGIGIMLGTLFISYPFVLAEKSNMDALYTALSVSRKTVVLGRYIFTLAINLCGIAFSLIFVSISLIASKIFEFEINSNGTFNGFIILASVFTFVQIIQLPLFFKLGYAKAKFLSFIPFCAITAGYLVINRNMQAITAAVYKFTEMVSKPFAYTAAAAVLLLAVYISYSLSVTFYGKREF
jgi:hypothetical protein